jgi:membrane protein DedA with SNARE-associated domain
VLEQVAHFVTNTIESMGYPGLFLLIMLESTLIPIPSELVMPFAGFLATAEGGNKFSLPMVIAINSVAAMVGSGICYWIGAKGGRPLLMRYGKYVLVRQKDIEKTEAYFARHGKATILIGRFLPVVRHIISVPAGMAGMPLGAFFTQTFIGASIWGTVLIMIGYELGSRWNSVATQLKHVDLIVGVVILCGLLALGVRFVLRRRRDREAVKTNAD